MKILNVVQIMAIHSLKLGFSKIFAKSGVGILLPPRPGSRLGICNHRYYNNDDNVFTSASLCNYCNGFRGSENRDKTWRGSGCRLHCRPPPLNYIDRHPSLTVRFMKFKGGRVRTFVCRSLRRVDVGLLHGVVVGRPPLRWTVENKDLLT